MPRKTKHIPVNTLPSGTREGIVIGRKSIDGLPRFEEVERPHRDNGHLFIVQEKGWTRIEIDFETFTITAPSVIYIHPSQVHRLLLFGNATVSSCIITSENLRPEYLKLLEDLVPAKPLTLQPDALAMIIQAVALCVAVAERTDEQLYNYLLKESCNTMVAMIVSQYVARSQPGEAYSRFEGIAHAFRKILERDFVTVKSPAEYARILNLSAPYLNECVKAATGYPVSFHIQQRVVLEAKRLLVYSTKSVKEIAGELGYDDYNYFTRLFNKAVGMTPLAFRSKTLNSAILAANRCWLLTAADVPLQRKKHSNANND